MHLAGEDENFETAKQAALSFVESALELLKSQRQEQFAAAEIDVKRLSTVAAAASSAAFSKESGAFPIPLFESVAETDQLLEQFTLRLTSVDRAAYTSPLMADPVSNEESWWQEAMSDRVAYVVLKDLMRTIAIDEVAVGTPDEYWAHVRDHALAMNTQAGEAILLVESEFYPRWLHDWRWGRLDPRTTERPADLSIRRSEELSSEAYLFHMNSVAVYTAPVERNSSYLLQTSLLREVRFTKFPNGLFVDVQFEPDPGNDTKGSLLARFGRQVSVGQGRAIRLRFG
jgi:hypothetical protein